MNIEVKPQQMTIAERQLPFEVIALVLQGGGALGAYQAGVYEALSEAGIQPNWIAGTSIGAINAAIIAGNSAQTRVERLREFWRCGVVDGQWPDANIHWSSLAPGDAARKIRNQLSAAVALSGGVSGFFSARPIPPWFQPQGTIEATSFYDTRALKGTLERLIDFDRLNAGAIRFSVGAVNVRTGNLVYFDTKNHIIKPEHVMASGALPPGFPAVEIEGEHYWDGGLVSNTPLQWVVDTEPRRDTLAFQVDLWDARGEVPGSMLEVITREKEIRYSSRSRAGTNQFEHAQSVRNTLGALLAKLPTELKNSREAQLLNSVADRRIYNIVHLIYRAKKYEGQSKDYEFSRLSMEEHWRAGYYDARRTLRHPEVLERPKSHKGVFTFDLARDGRE
jgi:NTE family protein